jgi:hypothetical protein
MKTTVPDILIERYRLDELPQAEARDLERQIAADPALRARVEALDDADRRFRSQHENETFLREVRARAAQGTDGGRRAPMVPWLTGAACVAAGLLFFLAMPRTTTSPAAGTSTPPSVTGDGDRVKGTPPTGPSLAMYRRTAAGSERLADGDVVRAGDLIRVGYASPDRAYGVILSIDGRGLVTIHLPAKGDRAVPLAAGKTILLDTAYELDDAPRVERFYFITGRDPFAIAPVIDAARRAAGDAPVTLPIAKGLDQSTFSLQKEARQ